HALPTDHAPGPVAPPRQERAGKVAELHGGALLPAPFFIAVRGNAGFGAHTSAGEHHRLTAREQLAERTDIAYRLRELGHVDDLAAGQRERPATDRRLSGGP